MPLSGACYKVVWAARQWLASAAKHPRASGSSLLQQVRCLRPGVWGKEPMVVVAKGSLLYCLGRRCSKASALLNLALSTSLVGSPVHGRQR